MKRALRKSISNYDPALVDFLIKHPLPHSILGILCKPYSEKPRGWVSVPDIVDKLKQGGNLEKVRSLRSAVHYYCKTLYFKYKAIDRDKNTRPRYYRINDKGKLHLNELQGKIEGKGEVNEKG